MQDVDDINSPLMLTTEELNDDIDQDTHATTSKTSKAPTSTGSGTISSSTSPAPLLTTYRVAMTRISSQQYFAKAGKKIPTAGQDEDTYSCGNKDTSDAETLAPKRPRLQSYTVAGNPQTTSLPSTTPGVTATIDAASTMSDTEEMAEEAGEAESILEDGPGFFDE